MGECSAIKMSCLNSLEGSLPSGPLPQVNLQSSTTSSQEPFILIFVTSIYLPFVTIQTAPTIIRKSSEIPAPMNVGINT